MLQPATLAAKTSLRLGCLVVAALLLVGHAQAAADRPVEGLIVPLPATITTESTGRLSSLLLGPLKRFEQGAARQGGRFVLILDFNPDGRRTESEDFGACYDLANLLRSKQTSLRGLRTVAFIHGDVRRHSVLPALACSELVFGESGRLGQVAGPNKALTRVEQTAYEDITRNRFPAPLVKKMFDPALEVGRQGGQFVEMGANPPRPGVEVVGGLGRGETAFYTFKQARDLGLSQQLPFSTLDDVRVAYGLGRGSLQVNLDRTQCWRIVLDGPINGELVEQTKRRVGRALRAGANVLLFEVNCAGGTPDRAHELGLFLAAINEERSDRPVETIAYLSNKARNLATFLAFGCDKILMQFQDDGETRDPNPDDEDDSLPREARLGGFHLFVSRHPSIDPLRQKLSVIEPGERRAALEQQLQEATVVLEESLRAQLVEVASRQMYPVALATGMFSRSARIHLVELSRGDSSGRTFLTEEEFQADQKGPKLWRSVSLVKPWQGLPRYEGRYLTLSARQAAELGVAHAVVRDLPELYQLTGIRQEEIRTVEADWLDGLADFLRDPWTSVILVMLGITCLILELKMPGVGLPGVIAAICFVLFFWAHSQLHGQITWLAILLFILGLVMIGLEVFVLPGFGVCGIAGTLLVLASLGLVAYGHWPRNGEEWIRFGNKIGPFGVSLLGSLVLVFLIVRYLPHIPVLNRLMSRPGDETDDPLSSHELPMHAELQALLGAIGVAATPLRPAGKTQFGENYVDVVAEGGYVSPGTRVQVIEVEGNRVVVREV
ncbi:MAG: NfeD family protein [Gemmataceae bacterium]